MIYCVVELFCDFVCGVYYKVFHESFLPEMYAFLDSDSSVYSYEERREYFVRFSRLNGYSERFYKDKWQYIHNAHDLYYKCFAPGPYRWSEHKRQYPEQFPPLESLLSVAKGFRVLGP